MRFVVHYIVSIDDTPDRLYDIKTDSFYKESESLLSSLLYYLFNFFIILFALCANIVTTLIKSKDNCLFLLNLNERKFSAKNKKV